MEERIKIIWREWTVIALESQPAGEAEGEGAAEGEGGEAPAQGMDTD